MEQVVRAALAPIDPSSQDRAVAASAAAKAAQAQLEIPANAMQGSVLSGNTSQNGTSITSFLSGYSQIAGLDSYKGRVYDTRN
jgi:hypothetical protein